ncbi:MULTISPECIES: sensor histidine kinase [Sorangium]|uniref:histidine kinase n=1 Tax=Sorangium cellulosum TaxID=56 RepID=A1YBT0_SORCE|nr:Jer3 [Sorangium cellulosum]
MKLARKLTLALVFGVFLVLALSAYAQIRREARIFENDVQRDHHTMARALAAAVMEVWRSEGTARALRLVEDANEREQQANIRWVWLDGQADEPHRPRLAPELLAPVAEGRAVVRRIPQKDADLLVTCVPVSVPGDRAGALELSESLAGARRYIRSMILSTAITTAALTLVCGLLTTGLGVWLVGRPMRTLIDQARRIGAGDLSGRLSLRQEDEIGELGREMNAMCDRLAAANQKLESEAAARIAALQQLRHAERLATVGKLASGIAHELGAPLQVVTGRARMLVDGDVSGDEVPINGQIILEQSQRMTQIIRQLLDFARRRSAEKQETALRGVIRGTFTMLKPLADKQGVTIVEEGDTPDRVVHADADQLQQALTNVVVNAIQAMPSGGTITVGVRTVRASPPPDQGGAEGDYIALSVRDEGQGMTADVLEHVFEPFFTTKPVGEGTGLGLPVAYGIIKEHGGWIDVDSRPGSGSQFTMYLPQEKP